MHWLLFFKACPAVFLLQPRTTHLWVALPLEPPASFITQENVPQTWSQANLTKIRDELSPNRESMAEYESMAEVVWLRAMCLCILLQWPRSSLRIEDQIQFITAFAASHPRLFLAQKT